jgi:hypothetical protein
MNEHAEQLREAFESHEHLAPDTAAVYARVQELARTHRRRRRGVQAAGGAVLGVSLVAGGLALPGLLPSNSVTVQSPAGAPAAAATTPASPATIQKDLNAYFAAGYGYDDAAKLAKIWKVRFDPAAIKAEAGRRLLAGETLPIKPGPEQSAPPVDPRAQAEWNAFFAAGYDYADAVKLAKIWHKKSTDETKVLAGKKLLAGQTLPIAP